MVKNLQRLSLFLKTTLLVVLFCFVSIASASIIEAKLSQQKVVKIAVTDIPRSFSPYAADSLSSQYSHLFFDPLVRWGQDETIEYRLLAKLKNLKNNTII